MIPVLALQPVGNLRSHVMPAIDVELLTQTQTSTRSVGQSLAKTVKITHKIIMCSTQHPVGKVTSKLLTKRREVNAVSLHLNRCKSAQAFSHLEHGAGLFSSCGVGHQVANTSFGCPGLLRDGGPKPNARERR